jgi:hypothetical protein
MRNHGVQVMLCPCIDCLNQKKFAQREIIFHHLVTRGFTKNYTCWNKHGEEVRTMCGSRTGGWSLPGVMSD